MTTSINALSKNGTRACTRQHTSAYVSIRQHTSQHMSALLEERESCLEAACYRQKRHTSGERDTALLEERESCLEAACYRQKRHTSGERDTLVERETQEERERRERRERGEVGCLETPCHGGLVGSEAIVLVQILELADALVAELRCIRGLVEVEVAAELLVRTLAGQHHLHPHRFDFPREDEERGTGTDSRHVVRFQVVDDVLHCVNALLHCEVELVVLGAEHVGHFARVLKVGRVVEADREGGWPWLTSLITHLHHQRRDERRVQPACAIRQDTSLYVRIRHYTSGYVSIRNETMEECRAADRSTSLVATEARMSSL
jgi:hypothetical protein